MLTHDEIINSVKRAFSPLHCVAEIWDHDAKLQYKVCDYNRAVVRSGEVALPYAQDEQILFAILKQVRERIQSKGHVLN